MDRNPGSWEGTILLFIVLLTVLVGVAYVLAINFSLPVPWLGLFLVALAVTAGVRWSRTRRG